MSTAATIIDNRSDENASTTPCFRFIASAWVYGSYFVSNQQIHETTIMIEQLRSLRIQLDTIHKARETEFDENVEKIKAARVRGLGPRSQLIVRLLKKSLTLKKSREGISNRMTTVELQIEALESSDFNRTMLKTMQSTADVMRKMGLDKGLSQADSTISELEENIQMACDMNHALSTTNSDYLNDDELDAELDELMDTVQPKPTPTPTGNKTIHVELPAFTPKTVVAGNAESVITESVEMVSSMRIDEDPTPAIV